jgi:hypothetical protein
VRKGRKERGREGGRKEDMQIKTTRRHRLTPVRMIFMKNIKDKCW